MLKKTEETKKKSNSNKILDSDDDVTMEDLGKQEKEIVSKDAPKGRSVRAKAPVKYLTIDSESEEDNKYEESDEEVDDGGISSEDD